jgi:hypothetical protein
VDAPHEVDGSWLLPVHCNIAGIEQVTVKPTAGTGALVCSETKASVRGEVISLTIYTKLAGVGSEKGLSSRCPEASLGQIKPGKYAVVYGEPGSSQMPIGYVTIGL